MVPASETDLPQGESQQALHDNDQVFLRETSSIKLLRISSHSVLLTPNFDRVSAHMAKLNPVTFGGIPPYKVSNDKETYRS